jgi:AmiR/NasT family two-component response regulator
MKKNERGASIMNKGTVLVVEDEVFVGEEIREDLERGGYMVPEVIGSGEDVVEAVARHKPDLVLMDVRINGSVDGIEAAFQAKAEFNFPVIYLTAFSDPETRRRAALTKPAAYILKPFDEVELLSTVEAAIEKARRQ